MYGAVGQLPGECQLFFAEAMGSAEDALGMNLTTACPCYLQHPTPEAVPQCYPFDGTYPLKFAHTQCKAMYDAAQFAEHCCSGEVQAAQDAGFRRCGPVDANGEVVNPAVDGLATVANFQCFACWDQALNDGQGGFNIDELTRSPACVAAMDSTGAQCTVEGGFCDELTRENATKCWQADPARDCPVVYFPPPGVDDAICKDQPGTITRCTDATVNTKPWFDAEGADRTCAWYSADPENADSQCTTRHRNDGHSSGPAAATAVEER